jgi:hypothetical protein
MLWASLMIRIVHLHYRMKLLTKAPRALKGLSTVAAVLLTFALIHIVLELQLH